MIRKLMTTLMGLVLVTAPLFGQADEASVRKAAEAYFDKMKIDEVRKLPEYGLYELRVGYDLMYTDEKASFFFTGNLIDAKTHKNMTQARTREISAIKFSDLPLEYAVKNVRGKGTRVVATFEDPNCTYCKQLQKELAKVDDITVYTFLLPILAEDSATKSRAIWCANDRAKAWTDLMIENKAPAAATDACKAPIDQVKQLGEKYRIRGTPTIFLANGQRIPGMVRAPQLEEMLKSGVVTTR
jgi:thiol:disulfide interchange protein DsbC